MSTYVYGTRLSYGDYLQAKSFEDGIGYKIDKQTRSIIASNEELQREHIAAIESLENTAFAGFEQLSVDMQDISSGIAELSSVFEWGFSELILRMGHINDALDELIKIAKTPAQTWAYEQFEIARDAFRQGLYDEALEYIDRSINGYGDNTGYKIEYRFHFLLGTVRIGSFKNNSPEVVNPGMAESAFLAAAKYARHDHPHEAGRALVAAGWAAYCQGKFIEAQHHTEQAISLYPDLAEAHFQLAKIQMHCGNSIKALPYLKRAIYFDRGYAIKAPSDDDFKPHKESVDSLLKELHQNIQKKANNALHELKKLVPEIGKCHAENFSLNNYADIAPAEQALKQARKAARNNTYFGYLDVVKLCSRAKASLKKNLQHFVTQGTQDVTSKISTSESKIQEIKKDDVRLGWCAFITIAIILSFIIGIWQGCNVFVANRKQKKIRQQWGEQVIREMRNKGFNPDKMRWEEGWAVAKKLGYKDEDIPPKSVGSTFFTFLGYFFFGSLLSFVMGFAADTIQKKRKVRSLKSEIIRLRRIQKELGHEMRRWEGL